MSKLGDDTVRVASLRFINQHLANLLVHSPEQDVRDLVAVQSQDFTGAKWELGQRLEGLTNRLKLLKRQMDG